MDLIQLKLPPDQVKLIAGALERDAEVNPSFLETEKLTGLAAWLRYRITLWERRHPPTTAA